TRAPRPGEVHGREYFFVTEGEFKEMAASGQLLEWARYTGNFYGTPKAPVAERLSVGLPSLLEVDVVGARQVRAAVPGALLVFLAPPSWDELVRRLTERGTESAEVITKRLAAARDELQAEHQFEITLVNTSVVDVCAQLVALMTAQPVRLHGHAIRRVDGGRYSGARGNHQPADRRAARRGGQQVRPGDHGFQAGQADQRVLRAAR